MRTSNKAKPCLLAFVACFGLYGVAFANVGQHEIINPEVVGATSVSNLPSNCYLEADDPTNKISFYIDCDSVLGLEADITASDAEINVLDGMTAGTAELNTLDSSAITFSSALTGMGRYHVTKLTFSADQLNGGATIFADVADLKWYDVEVKITPNGVISGCSEIKIIDSAISGHTGGQVFMLDFATVANEAISFSSGAVVFGSSTANGYTGAVVADNVGSACATATSFIVNARALLAP